MGCLLFDANGRGAVVTKPVIKITEAETARWREERLPPQQPTQSVGDRYFLRPAQEDGDWEALADYLEKRGEVTPAIQAFLVDFFIRACRDGRALRRQKRPQKARTLTGSLELAAFVFDLKQKGARDYTVQAERFFGVDRRAVQRAVNAWPKINAEIAAFVISGSPRFRRRG
jgi:hypothetical protein